MLGLGTYFYVGHLKNKIARQDAVIKSQNSKIEVIDKNQKATKEIVDNLAKIKRRASGEKATMQQAIVEPTPDNYVNFTRKYRVRPDDQPSPKNGKGAGHHKGKAGP